MGLECCRGPYLRFVESFCSCSHGAGRAMSRNAARRRFTTADLETQTEGIECRKDDGVLDEIPGAYKDIDTVMANQADLVEVVHTLRQIVNALAACIIPVCNAVALFLITTCIYAIIATDLFKDKSPEFFGSFSVSV